MAMNFEYLTNDDIELVDAAAELAKEQLLRAVSIVSDVSRRDANDVDSRLVAAVTQAMAANHLALAMSRLDLIP
jgi:hypothetical protein